MPAKKRPRRPAEQFAGEIEAEIVGLQYYGASLAPGQHVNLEREPENRYDGRLIRVENSLFQTVGYVARHTSSWLAPLIDSGQVRLEGYVPAGDDTDRTTRRLSLMVFLSPKGEAILASRPIETRLDALHAVALWVYHDARALADPHLIAGLAEGLEPLLRQDLLPDSKLLLSLIPGIARELRAAQGMKALATLKAALDQLLIGPPLDYGALTLFPLSWPRAQEPACALLGRAVRSGTAVVEQLGPTARPPQVRVHNKGLRPLLIPQGEILSTGQNRVLSPILLAAKSSLTLPAALIEQHPRRRRRDEDAGDPCHENVQRQLEETGADLPLPPGAAGVAIGRNDKIFLLDLFDAAPTLAQFWPRLRRACSAYRLQHRPSRPVHAQHVRRLLDQIVDHARPSPTAAGAGVGLEIAGADLLGKAVLYADRVCHVNAFVRTP